MSHRYLCWKDGDKYKGHQLLDQEQLTTLKGMLLKKYPVFESVGLYDPDGVLLSCPIYIDLDHTDYEVARKDCEALVYTIENLLHVRPEVFFSGNKGFHIIIPYEIEGPRSHLIVKQIVDDLNMGNDSIDHKIYGYRRYLRVNGSMGSRPGYYKIPIEGKVPQEDVMFNMATKPVKQTYFCDASKINEELIEEATKAAELCARNYENALIKGHDSARNAVVPITHCIEKLLEIEPASGARQHTVYVIAKFYKSQGFDEDFAITSILSNPYLKEFNDSDTPINQVYSTVSRVYFTESYGIGCYSQSEDAKLMRSHCDEWCVYNKELKIERPKP